MKEESDEDTIDVSADVEALTKDEDLSEDFKAKASTIFEAALKSKVSEMKKKCMLAMKKNLKKKLKIRK